MRGERIEVSGFDSLDVRERTTPVETQETGKKITVSGSPPFLTPTGSYKSQCDYNLICI